MKIFKRAEQEGLLDYAERLACIYTRENIASIRKQNGQFFTPKQISSFMSGLFKIQKGTIELLDPGAGTGILTAAFCERLLANNSPISLTIDAFENDPKLLPFLKHTLELIREELEKRGHSVAYNVHDQDFILENNGYFNHNLFWKTDEHVLYDYVISNPPYYKIAKSSPQSSVMMDLISGQPNIYALFMALSASMLKPGGEMVFITPRSFCSGLYYKTFRTWFLENMEITNIHIFESRKDIFDRDDILQENIIIRAKKQNKRSPKGKFIISISENKNLSKPRKIKMSISDLTLYKNGENFIRIPTSQLDVEIMHIVDSWPCTLRDMGLEISTGPIVPFRATEFLLPELIESPKSAPLLWMHNMRDMKVVWPLKKNNKPQAILVSPESRPLLLPVRNYVLLKRFSSKEQERRLYAAVLQEDEFPYSVVGIENHVNYIHKFKGKLEVYEAFGIAALLNSKIIDIYFRSINGNTQVNATEIRKLPFPEIENIIKIGELIYDAENREKKYKVNDVIADILRIDAGIIKSLNQNGVKHEKN